MKKKRELCAKKVRHYALLFMFTVCAVLLFQNSGSEAYDVSKTDISVVDGAGTFVLSNDKTLEVTAGGVSVTGNFTQSSGLVALEMEERSKADIAGNVTINTGTNSTVIHATNAEVNVGGGVALTPAYPVTSRNDIIGIHAEGGSSVNISNDVLINSNSTNLTGLLLDGSTAQVDGNVHLTAATTASNNPVNYGISAKNGSDVTIGGNVEISGKMRRGTGVLAEDSDVVIRGDIKLSNSADGNGNTGVKINGGSVTAENIKLTGTENNTGLVVSKGGTATINNSIVISQDSYGRSTGIHAESGDVTVGAIDIDADSGFVYGISAIEGTVRVEGDVRVNVIDGSSHVGSNLVAGLYLLPNNANPSGPLTANVGGNVIVTGSHADGIYSFGYGKLYEINVEGNVQVSDGHWLRGIFARGEINVSRDVSVTDSIESHGVLTYKGSDTVIDGNLSVTGGTGNRGYEVYFGNEATTLTVGKDVIVDGGQNNRGINTDQIVGDVSDLSAVIGHDLKVIGGSGNVGSLMTRSGDLHVLNNAEVLGGSNNYGIYASGGTATVDGSVNVTGGSNNLGIYALGSSVSVDKDITVTGSSNYGIYASSSSAAVDGNVTVTGGAYNNVGMALFGTGSAGTIKGNLNVSGKAIGVQVSGNNSSQKVVGLTTVGDDAVGVLVNSNGYAEVGSVNVTGQNAEGLRAGLTNANTGARIAVTGDMDVSGIGAVGAEARFDGHISLTGGNITVGGLSKAGLSAVNGGKFTLEDMTADAAGASLIYTDSSGDVVIANSYLAGNILHDGSRSAGSLNVSATDSSLTGVTQGNGGKVNLSLTDSTWRVTGNSDLGGGTLVNNGTVDYRGSSAFSTVTVGDLSGGGMFVMKTDIEAGNSDKLVVTGNTSGSYLLDIRNNGGYNTTGNEVLTMVETNDQNGGFALTHEVEVGPWKYGLRQNTSDFGSGAGWQLYSIGQATIPADGAISTFSGSYLLNYAETTFMQRMGDLRSSPKLVGLWARGYGGQFEKKSGGKKAFDMDFWGISIGYDRKVKIGWDGDLYVGAFFGYSQGDIDYENGGSGNVDSQTVGVYASFVSPGGFYADSVLKYRWRSSDFDTYDSGGAHVTSDTIHTAGFGWSLELGQRISFNGQRRSGWYMEPQVQIRYQRHDDGYYNLSNGLRIGTEGATSIIGRVGTLIGYETENRNFYAKVFRAREFDWSLDVYGNGDLVDHSTGSSWWIYGFGYTTKLNDKNSLYLDLERTSCSDFEQKWRLNLGWRMEL